jgi:uncharacterized protein (TIGR03083 family)
MAPPPPILVAHLIPKVERLLLDLLRSLTPEEWNAPTLAPRWLVKDVAAHLLDTHLRKLSLARDGYFAETPAIASPEELPAFINRLNEEGVRQYRRLSPAVLISLLEVTARASAEYHDSLDPFAQAAFPVSWAGETESLNWFDTARELTERWHHQQQIREAVGRPGLMKPDLYRPVLDCFLRALPHVYRTVPAPTGAIVEIAISGDCGGVWRLQSEEGHWRLITEADGAPTARIVIPQGIAWRVFTKGIAREEAEARSVIQGDAALARPALGAVAIVA